MAPEACGPFLRTSPKFASFLIFADLVRFIFIFFPYIWMFLCVAAFYLLLEMVCPMIVCVGVDMDLILKKSWLCISVCPGEYVYIIEKEKKERKLLG